LAKKIAETPLMKQYLEMKKKHPDAVLLFRVGDFYETFSDDARTASEILGITLTRRANGSCSHVELAGFPHHALDTYLPRLIRAGRRVAICEQLEDPKATRKLVKRGITELVTPGVNINDNILQGRENNFLASLSWDKKVCGVSFLDISTGEYLCAQGSFDYIDKLLGNIRPKEVLLMRGSKKQAQAQFTGNHLYFEMDDWVYTLQSANERLLRHFGTSSLKGFGVDEMHQAVIASGAILYYLDQTQHTNTGHILTLGRIDEEKYVRLDRFTVRNLELVQPLAAEGKSLIDILDKTVSPQGGRMLRRWVLFPLRDIACINDRLEVVDFFVRNSDERADVRRQLSLVGDLERIISKTAVGRVTPRELISLKNSLLAIRPVKERGEVSDCLPLQHICGTIDPCQAAVQQIADTLVEDAPTLQSRGNFVKSGINAELDDLRSIANGGKQYLDEMLRRETETTGISSLKIGFNNVFGYYLEVRNTHKEKVPDTWIRKQTLVNAERYVTPELKEYEEKILGAEDRISQLENNIFAQLVQQVGTYAGIILTAAAAIANIDCLAALAECAEEYGYARPVVDDSLSISISEGRHPVIERNLPPGEPYISNSLELDNENCQIMMITGPNMSGKSALLRQTALIVLMAQIGSFVPALGARIGVVDKIFTRVGASDNISHGESTFMVEMNEAAAILNNLSERSLILFDELGRGTSTYDGISIAWAIVEYIHENSIARPKTLFATHYHELNEMERTFKRIHNYNVSVKEIEGKVVFMRKLERGGSAHSFGIHVAKLAGLGKNIVKRADEVLKQLEAGEQRTVNGDQGVGCKPAGGPKVAKADVSDIGAQRQGYQLSIFGIEDPLLEQVRDRILTLDINNLTPVQALSALNDLKLLLTGKFE